MSSILLIIGKKLLLIFEMDPFDTFCTLLLIIGNRLFKDRADYLTLPITVTKKGKN
jgi:hypothetical protein